MPLPKLKSRGATNTGDATFAGGFTVALKGMQNSFLIVILWYNKANLRDLIAATGLVILLKLDSNRRFFSRETPNLGQNWRFF